MYNDEEREQKNNLFVEDEKKEAMCVTEADIKSE